MSSSSGGTTATTLHSVPPCATSRPFTEGSASPCTPSSCVRIMPTVGVTLRGRLTPARRRRGTVLARDRQLVQTLARMVNENPDPASVAFPFTHIARNKDMIKTDAQMRAVTTSTCTQPPHTYTRTIRTIPTTMHVTLGPTPAQFHKHTCITLASAHMHTCTNPHTHTNTHQLTRTDTNTHNHTHTSRHVVLARGARSCTLGRVRRMVTVKG
jgi:hypothetical protein